jgi:hypothetical protein
VIDSSHYRVNNNLILSGSGLYVLLRGGG